MAQESQARRCRPPVGAFALTDFLLATANGTAIAAPADLPLLDVLGAIAEGQVVPHYQPLVSLETGRLIGVEALARWEHPVWGRLPPAAFVPVLERFRRVTDLTARMLDHACRDYAIWRHRFTLPEGFTVAVNVSATEFVDGRLATLAAEVLRRHDVPGRALCLELTETAAVENPAVAAGVFDQLRSLGVRLAIDDFGAGHAAPLLLDVLAFDIVKIDQSYVAELEHRPESAEFIARTVAAAGRLVEVVAEGVETREQADVLGALGCRHGQGFGFGHPAPGDDVLAAWVPAGWTTG